MILVLAANGSKRLEAADVFNRFHCEVDAAYPDLETARAAWAGVVALESRETAWVDLQELLELAPGDVDERRAWQLQAREMAKQAARHGWFRKDPPAIKSHIVWRT